MKILALRPRLLPRRSLRSRYLAAAVVLAAAVPTLFGSACVGGDAPVIDCATADVKSFTDLQPAFAYCSGCHVSYDTYQSAVENAEEAQSAIARGSMPPGGMPDDLAADVYTWVQCGQPE